MRFLSAISFLLLLAACNPASDNRYRTQGVGLALYNEQTKRNSKNLNDYFMALCTQAGYPSSDCTPQAPSKLADYPTWSKLVETGYNDIDFKCDSYLNWIDSKRTEKIFVDRSTISLGTLLGGTLAVAGAGQDALAYVALALGFLSSVYDAYHNSLLLGLEGSTIKEIVNQRRLLHREKFKARRYVNRPDAVLALRTYLTYCTPQSILTDVNSFSRDAVLGNTGTAERAAQRLAQLIPTSNSPAGPTTRRNPGVLPTVPEIFEGPGFGKQQVEELQAASCIKVDGKPGKQTQFAVYILQESIPGFDKNGKISGTEWPLIDKTKCSSPFRNYFEKRTFGPTGAADFGKGVINQLVVEKLLDDKFKDKTIADDEVRKAISGIRSTKGIEEKTTIGKDIEEQITLEFLNKLLPDTYKKSEG